MALLVLQLLLLVSVRQLLLLVSVRLLLLLSLVLLYLLGAWGDLASEILALAF